MLPVALAVLFSFNNGRSPSVWQGFSWRWYYNRWLTRGERRSRIDALTTIAGGEG